MENKYEVLEYMLENLPFEEIDKEVVIKFAELLGIDVKEIEKEIKKLEKIDDIFITTNFYFLYKDGKFYAPRGFKKVFVESMINERVRVNDEYINNFEIVKRFRLKYVGKYGIKFI